MPLLEAQHLVQTFVLRRSARIRRDARATLGFSFSSAVAVNAVEDASLAVHQGDAVGLVGESGSGKSSLLRMLARLDDPTSGSIFFQGERIDTTPAHLFARSRWRRDIQMVFQNHTESLNPHWLVFDIIADPLRRLPLPAPRGNVEEGVLKAADRVALRPALLHRYPHQLSGGERARVGLARAIAAEPKLLLLDEPTSALDVSVQAVVLQLLAKLRQEMGLTYVFVSHDLTVVRLLCERIIVMYQGRFIEEGRAEEIFHRPAHVYTRSLIASIPGSHIGDEKKYSSKRSPARAARI
jgi:peptide/nickel transport system ATP-binding protein